MSTGNRSTGDTSFVAYLECSETKERFYQDRMHGLSSAGHPLLVRYDLDAVRAAVCKEDLERRRLNMWRYRELLPMPGIDRIVELGEALTRDGTIEPDWNVLFVHTGGTPALFGYQGLVSA